MDPQTVLLIIYGITQASQALVDMLRQQQGMTPEQLQAAWESQKLNLQRAADQWKSKPPASPS